MEREFQRVLIVVLVVGTAIIGVGGGTLVFIFRKFGEKDAGNSSPVGLIAGLIAFVLICCLLLFTLSYANR